MVKSAKGVVITVSWPKLITACGSLAAIAAVSLWTVGSFWLTDIKTDIREVRDDFKTAMAENATVRGIVAGTEKELTQKISETRDIVGQLDVKVGRLDVKVDALREDMGTVKSDIRDIRSAVSRIAQDQKR